MHGRVFDGPGCDLTWTAVETNHAYCDSCGFATHLAGDCGDYRVLTSMGVDTGSSFYYRRDTGALIASEFWSPPSPTGTCHVVATEASPAAGQLRYRMFSSCRVGVRPTGAPRCALTAAPRPDDARAGRRVGLADSVVRMRDGCPLFG